MKITEYEAAWNVTNAIQGMFIVSLPYAVFHGGYWAIIAMVGISYICCHTGKILVECLYEDGQKGRYSYNDVADEVFGKKIGGRIVNAAQLIELAMTCILYVVLCGDILSFPIALGIIVFSYTSQIFVCTLEENMIDKNRFHCMMHWSHIAAALCKAIFGYIGFLTWQEDTQEVIA